MIMGRRWGEGQTGRSMAWRVKGMRLQSYHAAAGDITGFR